MQKFKKVTASVLVAAMCMTSVISSQNVSAAKKPVLSKKTLKVKAGAKASIKVSNAKKAKISWKSSKKKVATVKKKGKYGCTVTGIKAGKSVVSCTVKKANKKVTLKCKVTVKKATPTVTPTATPTPVATATPVATKAPVATASTAPTATPVVTVEPTPVPTPDYSTLLGTYSKTGIIPYIGTCLNYTGSAQLTNEDTMAFVDKQYNSFTLENEMKPDTILRNSSKNLISVADAKAKGYFIPDSYKEETVPDLNFDSADGAMAEAYNHGLVMRGHTLVWHSQTPSWFFNVGYANSGSAVSEDEMDARLEFYVRNVMNHVMDKEIEIGGAAGTILYQWDVVNEYNHRSNSGWDKVYGNMGVEPSYVKKAFEIAYDELKKYDVQNKVILYSNDYDSYFVIDKELQLINFINEGEEAKICGGIGMQSHVDVDRPTLDEYKTALETFINTGLEVSITEFDATINWDHLQSYDYEDEDQTAEDQAKFMKEFMEMVVSVQKNRNQKVSPKGIVGFTLWGLYDDISWRKKSEPLLFGESINDPKPSFQAFLDAAKVWYK